MTSAERLQQIRELLAGYPRSIGGVTRPAADLEEEFYDASKWLLDRVARLEVALRDAIVIIETEGYEYPDLKRALRGD